MSSTEDKTAIKLIPVHLPRQDVTPPDGEVLLFYSPTGSVLTESLNDTRRYVKVFKLKYYQRIRLLLLKLFLGSLKKEKKIIKKSVNNYI